MPAVLKIFVENISVNWMVLNTILKSIIDTWSIARYTNPMD